ncbi:metalloproteinase [Aphelenchoides avenae]|nr:metalloproteinase [Aphelenchus avenae]
MSNHAGMILLFTVVAFAATNSNGGEASDIAEQVHHDFLAKYANHPSFAYLKRVAIEDRKNKLAQHKRVNVHESVDVKKRAEALEANGVNATDEYGSILAQNRPLAPFLYQGDLLLTETDAIRLNFTQGLKQRRAGHTITMQNGMTIELQKWMHDQSICYSFEADSDEFTMLVARAAFQFWTENSCLTWEEGCLNRPVIKISTNATDEKGKFDTAAHEASHVMGMFHEQARPDRDQYIDIVWDSITADWKPQYDEEKTSKTLGIPYDYGSNMHYTGYNNDPKIDMLAKKSIYQHTMGNKVGPIFNDIKFVNMYNDCMCKSGAKCENGGFPHPRDCSKCICPEGFGGRTCAERQQGTGDAPAGCGQTINASPSWQTADIGVPAPVGVGPYNEEEHLKVSVHASCCHWWIRGNGKRVELALDSVESGSIYECRNSCSFGGTEVKFEDLTNGGAR